MRPARPTLAPEGAHAAGPEPAAQRPPPPAPASRPDWGMDVIAPPAAAAVARPFAPRPD